MPSPLLTTRPGVLHMQSQSCSESHSRCRDGALACLRTPHNRPKVSQYALVLLYFFRVAHSLACASLFICPVPYLPRRHDGNRTLGMNSRYRGRGEGTAVQQPCKLLRRQ